MKYTFIAEKGQLGNDMFAVDLNGLKIPETVVLVRNFDYSEPLGICKPYLKDGVLMAEVETDMELTGLYPAIGFQVIKRTDEVVTEAKLYYVSVSTTPNKDDTIGPINN